MISPDVIKAELLKNFDNYIQVYFNERNTDKTFAFFSNAITGFGTGIDEIAREAGQFKELYLRDFEQAPEKVNVVYNFSDAVYLSQTSGMINAVISIDTEISGMPLVLNNLRISAVFIKENDIWVIRHMHISLPAEIHDAGESYPLKELEERNRILEKMVVEKTHELEKRNTSLEMALMQVKQLRGMMPICASCKKIRDDEGYWHQIEVYIRDHSDAEFTHSICPDCREKFYPGISSKLNL